MVDALRADGHHVVAMVRPTSSTDALTPGPDLTVVVGDLRQGGAWESAIRGVDSIVHLAAAASGSLSEQFAGTVLATEHLLSAIDWSDLARFVHISSFSVYDFTLPPVGGTLDESTPVEPCPARRDAYTTTKIEQERLVREACDDRDVELVVVRPGAVFGPGKEWDHGAAMRSGPFSLIFAPRSTMRLTYVTNCADAIAAAVAAPDAAGRTVNVVDDRPPTHAEFFAACRRTGATEDRAIAVPWSIVSGVGRLLAMVERIAFGGSARLPEILARRRQIARWKPLHYPNDVAKATLKWTPSITWEDGVDLMFEGRR